MGAPQIIIIVLWTMAFMLNLLKHGQPTKIKYHAGRKLLQIIIFGSLLIWGGFFG